MRPRTITCLLVLLCSAVLRAEDPQLAVANRDIWEVAHVDKARIGFFHTSIQSTERNNQKLLRTSQELNLTVKRYGDTTTQLRMISGTEEDGDGKVQGVFMRQFQDKGNQLVLNGVVKEGKLLVDINNGRIRRQLPWNDKVLGLYAQEHLFQNRKAKVGDQIVFQSYEPTVNTVVTVRASVKEREEVDVLGTRKKLMRVELLSDKIPFQGGDIQLPRMVLWLDEERMPLRRQVEIPGLGAVIFTRASRAQALAQGGGIVLPDIGLKTLIPVTKRLPRKNKTESVVYRITLKDDDKPETALASDDRQQIKNVQGQHFDLHVHAVRTPPREATSEKPKAEFLKSNYYIDSDHERVRLLARRAVGSEPEPWMKARLIEQWVFDHVKSDNGVAFGPASEVAQNLRGDCRQHALLATAMCRAADIPARTAVGLVYVEDRQGKGVFGFHMWTEVWINGKWLGLDGTLGEGSVGAGHIKISDHSWHEVQSLTPLLPVARVLGKMSIEILDAKAQP